MKRRGLLIKLGAFAVVALLAAAMELGTLTGPHVGTTHAYHATFGGPDGVSGLRVGNTVRVAGVPVGRITGVRLVDATHVDVTFTANDDQTLTSHTWATVRYANLLGQRFLALSESGAGPATPLPHGATIPQERTAPALSLTALFNGFRPLFAALTPSQVNDLSGDIIAVLQGQTGTIDDLIGKTADLTANLADRNKTFGTVVTSLSSLLSSVAAHDDQLAAAVTSLNALTAALHADGPALLDSLASVDHLIGGTAGLLGGLENHNLPADIADGASVTNVLAGNSATLGHLVDNFVTAFGDFSRVTQNGNWVNAYPCSATIITYGQVSVSGADAVKAIGDALGPGLGSVLAGLGSSGQALALLAVPTPLKLPNGVVGQGTGHTKVCR